MDCGNLDIDVLNSKEWIYTNGIGGYSSSTITGCNTRRYHGLLVASFNPPTDRKVLVSKLEEKITDTSGNSFELSTNQYNGSVHPEGYKLLTSFERKPFPLYLFKPGNCQLEKTAFMVQGTNTVVVEYCNKGKEAFELSVIVFLTNRDYHALIKENASCNFWTEGTDNTKTIYAYYGANPVYINHSSGQWKPKGYWHKDYEYSMEKERGLDFNEDTYAAGEIMFHLNPGAKAYIIFSTEEEMKHAKGEKLKQQELENLRSYSANTKDIFFNDLVAAVNQFVVKRKSTNSSTIIAGYHWFADWGRDTMITMRGICIALHKQEEAKSIIRTFLQYLDGGMLPNRFPDLGEEPEYNTIDATLWLFVVLHDYFETFRDKEFLQEVYPKLTTIIESHIAGTRYNIHVIPEGLLYGGEGIEQLTWMDARIGDYVVTPRHGCPVEINMLWYNAIKIYAAFSKRLKQKNSFPAYIKLFEKNFNSFFWNEDDYLNDVVVPGSAPDKSIRPNMIYAVSLPYTVLDDVQQQKIITLVYDKLFTQYGLRTLEKDHPDFKPKYEGDTWRRDNAYHQGTVWPFLSGEFFTAYLKTNFFSKKSIAQVKKWMVPLKEHFYNDSCLHGISEIFDGDEPTTGKGTIHQAWSIGALLQTLTLIKNNTPVK
jgi:predicted glycogen debranching enzyme